MKTTCRHGSTRILILLGVLLATGHVRGEASGAVGPMVSPVIADSTSGVTLRNVTVAGHLAYCSIDSGLLILDITDPGHPTFVSRLAIGNPRPSHIVGHFRIEIQGIHAYLPHWQEGVYVIDIANPGAPHVVGHLASPSLIRSLALNGNYAYLAGSPGALVVVDISDPTNPRVVDSVFEYLVIQDFAQVGTRLYVCSNFLYTFDVSDPAHPVLVHTHTGPGRAGSVASRGTLLYLADLFGVGIGGLEGLAIFDVSTGVEPVLLGTNPQHEVDWDAVPIGNFCYMTNESGGLHAADISDPSHPVYVKCYDYGTLPMCGESFFGPWQSAVSVTVVDGYAYVSTNEGLLIYALDSRGDINGDAKKNAADIILLVNYVFKSGPPPTPVEQGDTECLGGITSADIIYLVNFVFKSSTPPVCP
jgi:hypothetical protein